MGIIVTILFNNYIDLKRNIVTNNNEEKYYNSTNEVVENIVSNNAINETENNRIDKDIFTNAYSSQEITSNIIPNVWKIEIPKIGLKANISEGISKEILDKSVGHFEFTQRKQGNIGLAAHNRGYEVNYFRKIKELVIGDEIYYTYGNVNKKYKVNLITVIKDTEWTYLGKTKDNRITLITCLENEPEYRRCIQGIEY